MPGLPMGNNAVLLTGTKAWLLRLSTSDADEDDGDSPEDSKIFVRLQFESQRFKHLLRQKIIRNFLWQGMTHQCQKLAPSQVKGQVFQQKEKVEEGEDH